MKSGIQVINRKHARDYHFKETQKRLDEVVPAFNQQVLNALNVDYVPVLYYNMIKVGRSCTCEKHEPHTGGGDNHNPNIDQVVENGDITDYEIVDSDNYHSLFGDQNQSVDYDDEEDMTPLLEEVVTDSIFAGNNVNCGICYRSGFLPGFSLQRGTRILLTSYDVVDSKGYNLVKTESPYVFQKLTKTGYVDFEITVPKYYKQALFSIRNGSVILNEPLFYERGIVQRSTVDQHSGKKFVVRVTAEQFTHVVLEFHHHGDEMRVNIPNINRTLDYTMLETLGNLQVILPMNIGKVSAGDHIAIPTRNLFLKVVDIEDYQTSTMRQLEWRATCRVLQPQESLRKMSAHRKFT